MTITILDSLVDPLLAHVTMHGMADRESGGFFLGPIDAPVINVLAIADGAGVVRQRDAFRVSGPAIEQLFLWATVHELRVWAQVHAHPKESFLSLVDEQHGFRVEGFTSIVIPDFCTPPRDPGSWGTWKYTRGIWTSAEHAIFKSGVGTVVTFGEGGVR